MSTPRSYGAPEHPITDVTRDPTMIADATIVFDGHVIADATMVFDVITDTTKITDAIMVYDATTTAIIDAAQLRRLEAWATAAKRPHPGERPEKVGPLVRRGNRRDNPARSN